MTDHAQLVKRLLLNVPCWDSDKRKKPCGYDGVFCIECRKKQDAADTIEALVKERDEANRIVKTYYHENERLEAEEVRMSEALTEIKAFFNTGKTSSIPAKIARKALEPKP